MAMGVPVVCSVRASGGVDALPEKHLLTATTTDDYVNSIDRVLGSPAERMRLADAGRERVLAQHSWPSSMKRLDGLIATTIERRKRAA
jgi:glycosyltransferase involved in cell wall biosynthesis